MSKRGPAPRDGCLDKEGALEFVAGSSTMGLGGISNSERRTVSRSNEPEVQSFAYFSRRIPDSKIIYSVKILKASFSSAALASFSMKALCLWIAFCTNWTSWWTIESRDGPCPDESRRGANGEVADTGSSFGKCSICDMGRSDREPGRDGERISCVDWRGGVGSAFGGSDWGVPFEDASFSVPGENGGVCAYRTGCPNGLDSALGVEKEDRLENKPVELARDREPVCWPSDPAL